MTPGYKSIKNLVDALSNMIGEESFSLVGGLSEETDAIGWKLVNNPRYLFSVSTLAGELKENMYDFQVSICDNSLENGDICFLDDSSLEKVLEVTSRYSNESHT